jgi:HAMP domain-containing protein
VINFYRNDGNLLANLREVEPTENGNHTDLEKAAQTVAAGDPAHTPLIEARNLGKVYQTGAGGFIALREINLQVFPGEFLALVGKRSCFAPPKMEMAMGPGKLLRSARWIRTNWQSGAGRMWVLSTSLSSCCRSLTWWITS